MSMSHSARVLAEIAELQALFDQDGPGASRFALKHLADWRDPPAIETEAEYTLAILRRRAASRALHPVAHPSGLAPDEATLYATIRAIEQRLIAYNAHHELPVGPARLIARYMIYGRTFNQLDSRIAWMEALDAGILRKAEIPGEPGAYSYFVIGLRYKVGDNTFTTDKRGRDHRQFVETLGRQAIFVEKSFPFSGDSAVEFASRIPDLSEHWHPTEIANAKGGIRPIAITSADLQSIYNLLSASRHADKPDFTPLFSPVVTPLAPASSSFPIASPPQDLFAALPLVA